jgi:hypothetical protein
MPEARYEAVTADLSIARVDPWRVYDHKTRHALKNNRGEVICLASKDAADHLATLMNKKVDWKY